VAFLLSVGASAVESTVQFENNQVRVLKIKIMAHEVSVLHRDEYPHIVIPLKGGTITRLEVDGSMTDVDFPEGKVIFRKTDPVGEFHRSINNTSNPIELIIVYLKTQI